MIMPYLSPKCVIVIHDIAIHTWLGRSKGAPCCLLFSVLRGTKFSTKIESGDNRLPNIGAVVCDEANWTDSFSVFNLLSLRWEYMIAHETIEDIRSFSQGTIRKKNYTGSIFHTQISWSTTKRLRMLRTKRN